MLTNLLNKVRTTPVLMAGVLFFAYTAHAEDKQVRPNIHQLTNEKTAPKVSADNGSSDYQNFGEIHKHSIGIGVGQTFLRSDLAENGNDSITPELYYTYSASHSFDFVANAHYSTHSYLNREATIRGLALAIKGKGFQFDAFSPFVLGGVGFYLPSVLRVNSNGVLSQTRSQLVFGVNVGAGVELKLNNEVTVGVIAHYHDPFDVRQEVGPKLEASYMKMLLVVSYTFH